MQLGWDLYPAIVLNSDSGIKIADHGCGNAYVHTPVLDYMLTDCAEPGCYPWTLNSEPAARAMCP
jgi:hypothetical protein